VKGKAFMSIFVTGASGWIGSAAIPEIRNAGHEVVGLARSDAAAARVEALGAKVLRGDLTDSVALADAAAASDGVVHLGYHHDFSQIPQAAALDRAAIEAMGEALTGTGRPLLIASGTLGLRPGSVGTEEDVPEPSLHPRVANAQAAFSFADRGVRAISVRFAPTVHGPGDHGFIAVIVAIARDKGVSAYIGEGTNRWAAVHRLDAGALVALALDRASAGSNVHAIAEEGVPTRAIAEAIGAHLNLPVVSIPAERAAEHFGWIGAFFGMDTPASNAITRRTLGWNPTHPTLLEDLAAGSYFSI
jgi:nucleoside-diphosphate-sugar epimerase